VKAVFGVLALVIVLAVVGSLAKGQLHAIGVGGGSGRNAAAMNEPGAFATKPVGAGAAAIAADPNATVPQQARGLQERARADTVRALEQGAERSRRSDP